MKKHKQEFAVLAERIVAKVGDTSVNRMRVAQMMREVAFDIENLYPHSKARTKKSILSGLWDWLKPLSEEERKAAGIIQAHEAQKLAEFMYNYEGE